MKFKYNNVLIEVRDKGMAMRSDVLPVMLNHEAKEKLGECTSLRITEGGLFGDFETIRDITGLYPAIAFRIIKKLDNGEVVEGLIISIGVSETENQDYRIPSIGKPTATNH